MSGPAPAGRRLAVRLSPAGLRSVRRGHPWVFESSIESVTPGGAPGDLAVVFGSRREFVAIGLWDPGSPIRVRILHAGAPATIDAGWWHDRLAAARAVRAGLEARGDTTGFRWVHGESDGFGGLVVDRYDRTLVVKLYSAAWLAHLDAVVAALVELDRPERVVLRLSRALQKQAPADRADGTVLVGPAPTAPVAFLEHGLELEADVVRGQKTGYFLDQRDNRALVRASAAGARTLDVFSFAGGFSVSAAAGGATEVHTVDLSGHALESARRAMARNRPRIPHPRFRHHLTAGDAFAVLADLAADGARFDLVVIDPPSFAPNAASLGPALRSYGRLTQLGLGVLAPDGTLVQASCSSRVDRAAFLGAVHAGAARAGVALEELAVTGHPVDHPVGFPEAAYLKAVVARRA